MKILCKSLCILLFIPFLTLAIEPINPHSLCERFVGEDDQKSCDARMKNDDVDWYAATVCSLVQDDQQFWSCWDKIKGVRFNPAQLDLCADDQKLKDSERIDCLTKAQLTRVPASEKPAAGEFQPLKIKERK